MKSRRRPGHTITAIHQDRHGDIWIGTTTEGVLRLSGTSVVRYRRATPWPTTTSMRSSRTRRARSGWDARRTDAHPGRRTTLFTRSNGFPAEEARAIWEDRHRNLWVGTLGQGLLRWSGGSFAARAGEGSLSDDNVISLFEDQEGSLWVGTQKGLNRLKDVAFTSYSRRDGLSHEQVNSLLRSRDDSVWIGTDGGGLNQLKNGRVRVFTSAHGLGSDYIGPLFESRDGSLWVGGDGFVSHLSERPAYNLSDGPDSPRGRVISSPCWARTRRASSSSRSATSRCFASRPAGSCPTTGGRRRPLPLLDAARPGGRAVVRDRRKASLVSRTAATPLYTEKDGLPDDTVHSVYEDAQGTLWIATIGGLCRFREGRFLSFAGPTRPGSGVMSQVLEDSAGHLWMNGRRGIVRVRKEDLDAYAEGRVSSIPSTVYGTGDGMESADYNPSYIQASACRTGDGRLWFATTKGVAFIDPLRLPVNPLPPPVVLESARRRRRGRAPASRARASRPGRKKFEFHYTALSFVSPEKVRFRYILEGFDSDWTAAHDRRAAYYTNLPPGRYRFRVKAANADGVWNEGGAVVRVPARAALPPDLLVQPAASWACSGSRASACTACGSLGSKPASRRSWASGTAWLASCTTAWPRAWPASRCTPGPCAQTEAELSPHGEPAPGHHRPAGGEQPGRGARLGLGSPPRVAPAAGPRGGPSLDGPRADVRHARQGGARGARHAAAARPPGRAEHLPHRPGGPDQRPQALARGARWRWCSRSSADRVELRVRDNGRGFDSREPAAPRPRRASASAACASGRSRWGAGSP